MKGIVLAGGRATRLYPLTYAISKQLLPVYKQPMIFYPIKTLIDMNIKDILIITASNTQEELFKEQLGDGSRYGVKFEFIVQEKPNGLAEAFIVGEKFIGKDDVTLILGDNVFLPARDNITANPNTIFTYKVKDPSSYGVVELNSDGTIKRIVEKPKDKYISDNAVVGLYVFNNSCVDLAKQIKPSSRGELEIVDLIELINKHKTIKVCEFDGVWFDCGTPDDLIECAEFVRALLKRTKQNILLLQTEGF
jgi:glucose-1-phosphate thymidylyltransferase